MKYQNHFMNKRGSYIVEASIVLPIFIIAVVIMLSSIPIISQSENIIFSLCDEQRVEDLKSKYRDNPVSLSILSTLRCKRENSKLENFYVYSTGYKYRKGGMDNLINQRFYGTFSNNDPFSIFKKAEIKGKILSRAFVGKKIESSNYSRDDFENDEQSNIVYVFPEGGKKYHKEGCRYLRENSRASLLTSKLKKDYKPCKLCKARSIHMGETVYCFEDAGKSYHRADCKRVDKYYIEMEKRIAEKRGYMPCSICGG